MKDHPLSLAALLGFAACIIPGDDDLPGLNSTSGASATATSQSSLSASATTVPSTGTTSTAGTDPTATTDLTATTTATTTTDTTGDSTTVGPATMTTGTTGDATTAECMGDCTPRRVFVTQAVFPGDFASGGDPSVIADNKCNNDAMGALLPQTFKAWISNGKMGPLERFDIGFQGDYVLVDGTTKVASGFADLLDGTLAHAINEDVNGEIVDVGIEVWTGVDINGKTATICGTAWNSQAGMATQGKLNALLGSWTADSLDLCSKSRRFYCFEDP